MLEILAHADLLHELILVAVHLAEGKGRSGQARAHRNTWLLTSRELTDVSKHVLETIGELEGVNVAKTELDVDVDDELRETEDLARQMDCGQKSVVVRCEYEEGRQRTGVSETRLLALLGRERLNRFKVQVVVEVEVVEVLAVDEEVEHVVALPADLETSLDPVNRGSLEAGGNRRGSQGQHS